MGKVQSNSKNLCRICNNYHNNQIYLTKEMLNGTKETFNYMKCSNCGCLQILDIPKDISQYYTSNYYSFRYENRIKTFLRMQWAKYSYNNNKLNIIGWLIFLLKGDYIDITYLKKLNLKFNTRILDVGCGMGHTLVTLSSIGFNNLMGVDPFIDNSCEKNSIKILKKYITELDGEFDLIMSNWSFEHMDNQLEILTNFNRLLDKNGTIILRIPIVDSLAWKEYNVNWYNMDPPRHLYIHSYESLNIILKKAGLNVVNVYHESNWLSLFHSDCYKNDITYVDSFLLKNRFKILLNKLLKYKFYIDKNKHINENEESDLVCFILRKIKKTNL